MEELRIDCANLSDKEAEIWKQEIQDIWKLNQTMPYSSEYEKLLKKIIPNQGKMLI